MNASLPRDTDGTGLAPNSCSQTALPSSWMFESTTSRGDPWSDREVSIRPGVVIKINSLPELVAANQDVLRMKPERSISERRLR